MVEAGANVTSVGCWEDLGVTAVFTLLSSPPVLPDTADSGDDKCMETSSSGGRGGGTRGAAASAAETAASSPSASRSNEHEAAAALIAGVTLTRCARGRVETNWGDFGNGECARD